MVTANRWLTPAILLLVIPGGLLIAWLWETLNRLLAGHIEPARLLISVPVLAVFLLLLRYMARTIAAWDAARDG